MKNESEPLKVPKTTEGDLAHLTAQSAIGVVPIVGGPLSALFGHYMQSPYQKRSDQFFHSVKRSMDELRERVNGLEPEQLADNPAFVSSVAQAIQGVFQSDDSDVLNALRIAVLNSALPQVPGEAFRQRFMDSLRQMTSWHLAVLYFLNNPADWFRRNDRIPPQQGNAYVEKVVAHAYPELGNAADLRGVILRDLYRFGYSAYNPDGAGVRHKAAFSSETTELGKQFVQFALVDPLADCLV